MSRLYDRGLVTKSKAARLDFAQFSRERGSPALQSPKAVARANCFNKDKVPKAGSRPAFGLVRHNN